MRWQRDGVSVEQPGDVWGRVSFCYAGKTSGGARRDELVGEALCDRNRFCGGVIGLPWSLRSTHTHTHTQHPSCLFLTKNIHSIVSADHNPLVSLSSAGVTPFIAPRHRNKGQVVVLPLVKRSWGDLLTILKPFGCWCRTTRHSAFQHQRLWLLHQNSHRGGGVNYLHWGGRVWI